MEEKDRVIGYRNSPVASEIAPQNLMPGEDANIENLPEVVDDEGD